MPDGDDVTAPDPDPLSETSTAGGLTKVALMGSCPVPRAVLSTNCSVATPLVVSDVSVVTVTVQESDGATDPDEQVPPVTSKLLGVGPIENEPRVSGAVPVSVIVTSFDTADPRATVPKETGDGAISFAAQPTVES
jgi:hypothetical protein